MKVEMCLHIYLEKVIRGVVNQHDESSSTNVIHTPGETDEKDGCNMVNDVLLKVLKRRWEII